MEKKEKLLKKKRGIQIGKRTVRISDLIFWIFIVLLIIPQTRSIVMGGVSKVRTAIFTPALKAQDGPILNEASWNWQLTDLEGKRLALSSFKNQVILMNSWATWCPPCRAEMPSLEKLSADYHEKIAMVLVTQEEVSVAKEYITKKGYTFPVYIAAQIPPEFASRSIPATFIVDQDGKVVYSRTGAFDWNSQKVRKFLDKLLSD